MYRTSNYPSAEVSELTWIAILHESQAYAGNRDQPWLLGGSDPVIPDVSREKLIEAIEEFDKALRDTDEWSNWEQKGTYKYAIVHEDKRYPVKQIISMATGEPRTAYYEAIPVGSAHRLLLTRDARGVLRLLDGQPQVEVIEEARFVATYPQSAGT